MDEIIVDAEIISSEWRVTPKMIQEVAGHICNLIAQHPVGVKKVSIDGNAISNYFGIPNGLTKVIMEMIRQRPPNWMLSGRININTR